MSRINSNIPSLIARTNLERSNRDLELRLERLSTGLRINRGKDDPAGLIISERLRSNIAGVDQGIKNSDRASSVISTAESALAEVNELLNSIRALIVEAANTGANSEEERRANQLQIDSAIDSITRIANTASFGDLNLLNGSLDYVLSGITSSAISKARVFSAQFNSNVSSIQVDVETVASAQTGGLYIRGDYAPPNDVYNGTLLSAMTLEIKGPDGVEVITLASGTSLDELVSTVNTLTAVTGVEASRINAADVNSGIVFRSVEYGSDAFVSVTRMGGPDNPADDSFQTYKFVDDATVSYGPPFDWDALILAGTLVTGKQDSGRDVAAIINGMLATGDGLTASLNTTALSVEVLLNEDLATMPGQSTTFEITGGGALFQLGPEVTALQQTGIGLQSVAAANLGGTLISGTMQFLSSLKSGQDNSIDASESRNDFTAASSILQTAIDETTILRGRLGAFERNVLEPNIRSLQTAFENLTASESRIRDADFAAETSRLTRAQILSRSGTTVLALANQQSQQILQLLS